MTIQVFVSRPTVIAARFESQYVAFQTYLLRKGYCLYRLGADNYTMDAPLKGVMRLMRECKAAIVLGYPQFEVKASLSKAEAAQQELAAVFPTPWNQIEATLAFKQRIPVIVVAHTGVSGGVFDHGVTGEYVHTADLGMKDWYKKKDFQGVFQEWQTRIKR
ncbi:MAG: hypothetical protein A4E63_02154 [Syntrophorhabdus sp. PtaU1.Bin050]|nr:MAG: hypothetical protein A4E63_02154 [Syntrophorhabdus sp. PtaU1.Bin050]